MNAEEEFIVEEEWVEEDFIDGESYEEEVMEEDVVEDEMKSGSLLQRSTSNADVSFDGSSIVEFDLGSYNGGSSSGEGEPDNYEEACRALIKQVYPQGGSHDEDDMIRRCDLRNLYRNLKQQHKFLVHSKNALAENDGRPERWESFDDSNGALSVEAVDQAVISFDEPLQQVEKRPKNGSGDRQIWPEMEDFADPWGDSKVTTGNAMSNDHNIVRGPAVVDKTQDKVMREVQDESSEVELIPWLLRHADDPDDYEAACRELIPVVYKDEDETDVDTMLRRSDPKDLYRHLKHQHWYLTHTGAISEEPASDRNVDTPVHAEMVSAKLESDGKAGVSTSVYNKGPSLDDIWLVAEENNEMRVESKQISQESKINKSEEASCDVNVMDEDGPAEDLGTFENSAQHVGAVHDTVGIPSDTMGQTSAQTRQHEYPRRSADEAEDEQDGKVIKWLDRYADDPDDYEEACRILVSVLFAEDDEYDTETTLNRSSPKELFRYLKQQYWYRVHMGSLPENALEQRLSIPHVPSATAPKLPERTKLIDVVNNRVSLIESANIEETHFRQENCSASSATSPPPEYSSMIAPKSSESDRTQPPGSKFIQAAGKPPTSGKRMLQRSSLAVDDGITSYDGMDSSDSSLEPPPGYDPHTLIKDRAERLERASRDNAKNGGTKHNDSQNLEGSSHTDASSVYSHENRIDDIIMDGNLRNAILDEINRDEVAMLHEPHQNVGESSNVYMGDVAVHHIEVGLPESQSTNISNGTHPAGAGLVDVDNANHDVSRDQSTVGHEGAQGGKRNGVGSSRLDSNKRARNETEVESWPHSRENHGRTQNNIHEQTQPQHGEINLSEIQNVAVNVETMGDEEKKMWDNIDLPSMEDEQMRIEKFHPNRDRGILTGKLDVDGDDVQSIGGDERGIEEMFAHHDHGTVTGKLEVDRDDVQSIGREAIGTENTMKYDDRGFAPENLDLGVDDVQVAATEDENASGDETAPTLLSSTNKDVTSFSTSPANAPIQDNIFQARRPAKTRALDRVNMTKRQNRIEDELFPIVSDAEKMSGEPFSEEMLAALILAATKTAHLKRYYNFVMDTFVFLPRVANAVLNGSLLDCASRHVEDEISSQHIAALTAASEKAVDRNLDYEYMESHAVTLDITFPKSAEVGQKPGTLNPKLDVQNPEMLSSKLDAEDDIVRLGPLESNKQLTSAMPESNSLKNKAVKNEGQGGLEPSDLVELEEEARLLDLNYQEIKASLLRECVEIEQKRNLEMDRIKRELDALEDFGKQLGSNGARNKKDVLVKQLNGLKENLATAKEHLEHERGLENLAKNSGENNSSLFGIFGVRRRAMDLEKEKEQQAQLMQQKIKEMEIQQGIEKIEREIATVQTRYDELREQESTLFADGRVDTETAPLLQESREIEETFLRARKILDEGLNALEERRIKDETWYRREKAAILSRSTSNDALEVNNPESDSFGTQKIIASVPLQAPNGDEFESKLESNTTLSAKVNATSRLAEGMAHEEEQWTETENYTRVEVERRPDPSGIFPDHLEGANPVTVGSLNVDSVTIHPTTGQLQPRKALLVVETQEKSMQLPHKSPTLVEDTNIGEDEVDIVPHLSGSAGSSADQESLEHVDHSELPEQHQRDNSLLVAALKPEEPLPDQHEGLPIENHLDENERGTRAAATQKRNEKKVLMLFSSTTVDLSQQTNQRRAVVVLKAKNIDYNSVDGSDPDAVAKRNELFRISNLRGTYPQFFIVEGGSISFVGTFESIQDLNDRGLLKTLADNKEEHYRQEFMELLERDDRGESVDEDRLYHLQLYARRRVGEDLSASERLDLEEFEREEAKLEISEPQRGSVWQGHEGVPDKARNDDPLYALEPADLRNDCLNPIINGQPSAAAGEEGGDATVFEKTQIPGSSPSSLRIEPSHSQSTMPSLSPNPDRLLKWRKNGKQMVAAKLQPFMSQTPATEMRNGLEGPLEGEVQGDTEVIVAPKALLQDNTEKMANEKKTEPLVPSKAQSKSEKRTVEKKSRKEVLAAKRKQIVKSRRAKWGLKSDTNAASEEMFKDTSCEKEFQSDPGMSDEKRKQRMEESKRLAEKTAKARESRLAREAELQRYTQEVKQKGRMLKAKLEKQNSAEEDNASPAVEILRDKPPTSKEGSLLPPLVKEVERLSGFITRYEKKLETTCKSILSVIQKTGQNANLERLANLGLPEMYNYVTDQPWYKEHASKTLSRPLSVSQGGIESTIKPHLVAFGSTESEMVVGGASHDTSTELKKYKLSKLGEKFIAIDGPGCGDTGRFLSSLSASEHLSKSMIRARWSDISRLSGDNQSDRICKNIEDIISFCSSSGLIE